jgi:hypothetical protein
VRPGQRVSSISVPPGVAATFNVSAMGVARSSLTPPVLAAAAGSGGIGGKAAADTPGAVTWSCLSSTDQSAM